MSPGIRTTDKSMSLESNSSMGGGDFLLDMVDAAETQATGYSTLLVLYSYSINTLLILYSISNSNNNREGRRGGNLRAR